MPFPTASIVAAAGSSRPKPPVDPVDFNPAAFILANGKAYWRFEADGTDTTGRGNGLTATNAPTYAAGKVGNAVSLAAASSQYLSRPSTSDLSIPASGDFIVATWVKPNADGDILGKGGEYGITFGGGAVGSYFAYDENSAGAGASGVNVGAWNLVIVRLNTAAKRLDTRINNGTLASYDYSGDVSGSPLAGAGDFKVGYYDNGGTSYDGLIDDTLIVSTNSPMSAEEFDTFSSYLWAGGSGLDLSFIFGG